MLKSHFNLDRSIDTEKEPELINLGRSLATVVLLTNNELIEYSMSKRDLKELPTLVEQLEKKNCFMNDELLKLELNYRKAKKTDEIHLKNQTLEQVFLGNLTEYTIDDFFENFENKENEEILEIYTIPNSNNTGYQMVYKFKNKKLIYKEVFDSLKLPMLKKSLEEFNQINNLEAFKKKFSIMNM